MTRVTALLPLCLSLILLPACASAPPAAAPVSGPVPQEDAPRRPHPDGVGLQHSRALFRSPGAPALDSLENCDFDYGVERQIARDKEELFTTFPVHVKADPARYHWCFYSRLLRAQERVERIPPHEPELPAEVRQRLLDDFSFLTHLARIFEADLDDPVYLRHVAQEYKKVSERFFLRVLKNAAKPE